jgi:hypothetical protein
MTCEPSAAQPAAKPRRTLRGSGGFTLLEVAVAAFVLLFGISSAIVAMQIGYRSMDLARTLTLTAQVLQSEIEIVRMKAWGDIASMASDPDGTKPLQVISKTFANAPMPRDFKLLRQVDDKIVLDGEVLMREITVTASWKTIDGISHTRSTSTQYCKEGLNDYYVTYPSS